MWHAADVPGPQREFGYRANSGPSRTVWNDRLCAGFRMPAMPEAAASIWAGVRKPPRNEPAGDDARRGAADSSMGI
jgi:hypothetical protein